MGRTRHEVTGEGGKGGTPRRPKIPKEIADLKWDYTFEKDLDKKKEIASKIKELEESLGV